MKKETTKNEMSEQEKLSACNKEVTEVLEKYGYSLQVAHLIQFVKKQ